MMMRLLVWLAVAGTALAQEPAAFTLAGDWEVQVSAGGKPGRVRVSPQVILSVPSEKYGAIPVFNPKASGWAKGARLEGVKAMETTTPKLLDVASVVVRSGPEPDAPVFTRGEDYELDPLWGTFGRLAGGRIAADQAVWVSYRHALMRLDSVVLMADGRIGLHQGIPRAAAPVAPGAGAGETLLGNVYLPGAVARLSEEHLFPVLEREYPARTVAKSETVLRLARRLEGGWKLRILAWGDSVTDAAYLENRDRDRWQEQFVARLRRRFPKASIELLTQAWGGRNTGSYLGEPAGSPHNYQETVLGVKPDLVISEFVNDAGLKPAQVEERYSKLLADFKGIGAEWVILTPHYVRPDWMELTRERDVDEDPRPYVAGLRQFAATHDVGLADASLRYGRLWRQGIPQSSLLLNAINHPNAMGMRLFADALMALFE